jgi:hypothetical protein
MKYSEYTIRTQFEDGQALVDTFEAPSFREAIARWQELVDGEWDRYRRLGAKYMILVGKGEKDGMGYPLRSVSISS